MMTIMVTGFHFSFCESDGERVTQFFPTAHASIWESHEPRHGGSPEGKHKQLAFHDSPSMIIDHPDTWYVPPDSTNCHNFLALGFFKRSRDLVVEDPYWEQTSLLATGWRFTAISLPHSRVMWWWLVTGMVIRRRVTPTSYSMTMRQSLVFST